MRPLRGILQVLGMSRGVLSWLIRDEFNDTDTSPINAPRNAVPGPGVLTFTETDGSFAIGSGVLEFNSPVTPAYDVLRFGSVDSFSRNAGRALVTSIQIDSGDSAYAYFSSGSGDPATLDDIADGLSFYFEAGGEIHVVLASGITLAESIGTWSTGVSYKIAMVQLSAGALYFINDGSGWKNLFYYPEGISSNLYPYFTVNNADGHLDYFRFWDAGVESFAPSFEVTPGEFTQAFAGNELTDGGMELWANPNALSQWVESVSGTSTLNRESSDIDAGVYAARFDIDGSNSDVSISQGLPSGTASDFIEVQGYVKSEPSGASYNVATDFSTAQHTVSDTYSPYTDLLLVGEVAGTLAIENATATSSSLYFDNFSARRVTPNNIQSTASDALIDFEFILPDTPVGLMLMQAMEENFLEFLYRLVLGLVKTLLKQG